MPKFMIMRRKLVNGKEHKKEMLILNVIVGSQLEDLTIQMNNLKEHLENISNTIRLMDFGSH